MYVDAKKTVADGRKLPQSQCVDYPQMHELKLALEHLGYEAAYEEKAYPRDLTQFGRFRVLLKDPASGEPKVEGIANSAQLSDSISATQSRLLARALAWFTRASSAAADEGCARRSLVGWPLAARYRAHW